MKVAVATDDGKTVSQDLASAKFFLVYSTEGRMPLKKELRMKPRMVQSKWSLAGSGPGDLIGEIAEVVSDCHLLVVGGMRRAELDELVRLGRKATLTDLVLVDDSLRAALKGTLDDHPERLR